jgi:uncharacterized protein YndB with AHSA1/START domain
VGTTRATRWVRGTPAEVYRALLDPFAVAAWRVPNGMTATIHRFDARPGGRFRITLHPEGPAEPGRTGTRTETFRGQFTRLVPGQLVVEVLEFESPASEMAGAFTITTELAEADGGCEVIMTYADVPPGAGSAADEVGIQMSLVRLAAWVETDRQW